MDEPTRPGPRAARLAPDQWPRSGRWLAGGARRRTRGRTEARDRRRV